MKIAFVEQKAPDLSRVDALLKLCGSENHWANRGPVYRLLQQRLKSYLNLPSGCCAVPVSNGGVALEVMARLHAKHAGKKLRWVASAYSFQNLGRGYFNDATFVDCDAGGLLSLAALEALDPESYDGIIVTNPFGLYSDLSAIVDFAKRTGKALLADNAAGFFADIPDLPWQAFSLHHTKPFGMGEGGVAVVPQEEEEALYSLVDYGPNLAEEDRAHWFQNGKISDISCAMILDRLVQAEEWIPGNLEQRERVIELAAQMDLRPLYRPDTGIPMTSIPLLYSRPITQERVDSTRFAVFAKYYRPLADLPNVTHIYQHLVNVPCHADMAALSDDQILTDLSIVTARPRLCQPASSNSQAQPSKRQASEGQVRREGERAYGGYRGVAVPLQRS